MHHWNVAIASSLANFITEKSFNINKYSIQTRRICWLIRRWDANYILYHTYTYIHTYKHMYTSMFLLNFFSIKTTSRHLILLIMRQRFLFNKWKSKLIKNRHYWVGFKYGLVGLCWSKQATTPNYYIFLISFFQI